MPKKFEQGNNMKQKHAECFNPNALLHPRCHDRVTKVIAFKTLSGRALCK